MGDIKSHKHMSSTINIRASIDSNESLERIHTFSLKSSLPSRSNSTDVRHYISLEQDHKQSKSFAEQQKTFYVEEKVKIVENVIMQSQPILNEMNRLMRIFGQFPPNEEQKKTLLGVHKKRKISFDNQKDIDNIKNNNKFKLNIRNVLGIRHQDDWIFNLNIGNVMHLSTMNMDELNSRSESTHELNRDAMLEKIVLMTVSYFCVGTEIRFLSAKEEKGFIRKNSEYWHAKSLHLSCCFLPSDCPLVLHIINSYSKHHLKIKEEQIKEDLIIQELAQKKAQLRKTDIIKKSENNSPTLSDKMKGKRSRNNCMGKSTDNIGLLATTPSDVRNKMFQCEKKKVMVKKQSLKSSHISTTTRPLKKRLEDKSNKNSGTSSPVSEFILKQPKGLSNRNSVSSLSVKQSFSKTTIQKKNSLSSNISIQKMKKLASGMGVSVASTGKLSGAQQILVFPNKKQFPVFKGKKTNDNKVSNYHFGAINFISNVNIYNKQEQFYQTVKNEIEKGSLERSCSIGQEGKPVRPSNKNTKGGTLQKDLAKYLRYAQ